jgi:hypothetical protein
METGTIAGGVLGLLSGAVASLIAPWVHWRIESRRAQMEYRRERIACWRQVVEAFDFREPGRFGAMAAYSELQPHLSKGLQRAVTHGRIAIVPGQGRGDDGVKVAILDAIAKLERKWHLI